MPISLNSLKLFTFDLLLLANHLTPKKRFVVSDRASQIEFSDWECMCVRVSFTHSQWLSWAKSENIPYLSIPQQLTFCVWIICLNKSRKNSVCPIKSLWNEIYCIWERFFGLNSKNELKKFSELKKYGCLIRPRGKNIFW